ncbi:MAG: hypothetical protein Q4B17_03550 [Lautropia sp.]|nr:hypothetical protein [Lautropia sp.]
MNKKFAALLSGAVAAGALLGSPAFAAVTLADGYQVAAADKAKEGKCGEGKCGADEKKADKSKEGKCGEGKCGS